MNDLWDVYTLTNIAGIAVSFSGLSLLLTWLFSSILLRPVCSLDSDYQKFRSSACRP